MGTSEERLYRAGIYAMLVIGSLIFSYPFVWMLFTSAKVPREFGSTELRLLPDFPKARPVSPYLDLETFPWIEEMKMSGAERAFWERWGVQIDDAIRGSLAGWTPRLGEDGREVPPRIDDRNHFERVMLRGLRHGMASRIADDLLGAEAPQVLSFVREFVTEERMALTFDLSYRRFVVGGVRLADVRQNHTEHTVAGAWRAHKAELVYAPRGSPAYEIWYAAVQARPAVLTLELSMAGVAPEELEKIFIRYRGDSSWSEVRPIVRVGGETWRADGTIVLYERDWVEAELRFPRRPADPMERRTFYTLEQVEASSGLAGSPDTLEVELQVFPRGTLGAIWAKLTHNYGEAFRRVPFSRYILTSFSLVILNMVLAVFSCTLVAYAFARLDWPGRDICFGIVLGTMMIPAQVTMIPNFLVMKQLGWFNTLLPLWLPALFGAPFFIFLLRQFLKNIPRDLEEAASIDGCGFLRIYWHVMLPLVRPTVATIAIFTFIGSWNNFMGPLIYLNDERLYPLALGLFRFNVDNTISGGGMGLMMAGSFVMTLPIIVLFFFAQKYFIQGLSFGGGKE